MKPTSSAHALLLCAFLVASTSCGDDDERRSYQVSCDAACERAHECSSSVNVESCAMDCKEDTAMIGPRLSNDFLAELDGCIAEASCPQLALMPALQSCQAQAAAKLAPSTAAEQLCAKVVESVQMCLGLTVPPTGCLGSVKIFADSALIRARSCASLSCDQRIGCLQDELGINPVDTTNP